MEAKKAFEKARQVLAGQKYVMAVVLDDTKLLVVSTTDDTSEFLSAIQGMIAGACGNDTEDMLIAVEALRRSIRERGAKMRRLN